MTLARITGFALFRLQLPLLAAFEHAGAKRERTDNVICELTFEGGVRGYGEAVPRAYVTGETPESCWRALIQASERLPREVELRGAEDAVRLARDAAEGIPDAPESIANAARCALELALLDGAFRVLDSSPVDALALGPRTDRFLHSMVAGKALLGDEAALRELRGRYGYTAVKAKVGFGLEQDLEHLARLRRVFGPGGDIRVDANRAFSFSQAAEFLERARSLGVRTIEDPLAGEDLAALAPELRRLREATGCEVVLDEPVRTRAEALLAIEARAVDIVSVRLSKCGGLLRGLEIASLCRARGIGVQLGCQVGETAILSAAGRRFAECAGPLRFIEGSNERLKFARESDVCREDLMYGPDATSTALRGPGLGLEVLPDQVRKLASERLEIAR